MTWNITEAQKMIDDLLQGLPQTARGQSLLTTMQPGKVFELWALCEVIVALHNYERYSVEVRNGLTGAPLTLRASPGPIDRRFASIYLTRPGRRSLVAWTDVEFLTLSSVQARGWPAGDLSDRHELDIVIVPEGVYGYPTPDQVVLGVECKATAFSKDQLRAILGVRRELSLLSGPQRTEFDNWPARTVPATPASYLALYSRDRNISRYIAGPSHFGVGLGYLPLP